VLSAQTKSIASEYRSGSRRLADGFWLEGRLRHSCQRWLRRQHRPRARDVLPGRCKCVKRILALQTTEHPCRAQLWGSRNYRSGTDPSVAGWCMSQRTCQTLRERSGRRKALPSDLSKSGAIKKTQMVSRTRSHPVHEYFAADLSVEQAAFMARSQVLNAAGNSRQSSHACVAKQTKLDVVAAKTEPSTLT